MADIGFEEARQIVLYRDRGRCQECGANTFRPHVHHKKPRSQGGSDHPNNLETLCPHCHSQKHGADICTTCGGILHERSQFERGLMDKKGGSPVLICEDCWGQIVEQGCETGCRLCPEDTDDTRYSAGIGADCGPVDYSLCDGCRKRLLFNYQYSTMKFYDEESPVDFRHWEGGDD